MRGSLRSSAHLGCVANQTTPALFDATARSHHAMDAGTSPSRW